MRSTTYSDGMQVPDANRTAGGEDRQNAKGRHRIEAVLWSIGVVVFILSCLLIHTHPLPFPFELAITQTIQAFRPWPWVNAALEFPSTLNNPLPSIIALGCWLGGMVLMALVFRLRGKSPLTWLQSALFLVLTVMSSAGLNVIIDELVARPRPNPRTQPVHVDHPIVPFPTYPSGHTEHDVVYYGFLLYLSFTKPLREWRYRWLLLPLQFYAVFDILSIGYSRILEGDHWLLDILGGYLEGLIYLFFFIFLYRWSTDVLMKWHARRAKAVQVK